MKNRTKEKDVGKTIAMMTITVSQIAIFQDGLLNQDRIQTLFIVTNNIQIALVDVQA